MSLSKRLTCSIGSSSETTGFTFGGLTAQLARKHTAPITVKIPMFFLITIVLLLSFIVHGFRFDEKAEFP
jgi:hypothetical protein